jgi:RHS repeat-associated protein
MPDGTVWGWGDDGMGEMGNPAATAPQTTPVQVVGPGGSGMLSGIVQVSPGAEHELALKSDGTVWAWGDNADGELGAPSSDTCTISGTTYACSRTPIQVQGPGGSGFLTGVIAVAGGQWHSLALKSDGTVWAWGYNGVNELGDGTTTSRSTPVQVLGPGGTGVLSGVTAIGASGYWSSALKSDGTVWAWGTASGVTLTTLTEAPAPNGSPATNITALALGHDHALLLKNDGTLLSGGSNTEGQLGDGASTPSDTTVVVVGPGGTGSLSGITAISAGYAHSLALKNDGTVWSWGSDAYGQLGYDTSNLCGTDLCMTTPGQIASLSNITSISAGYVHSTAVTASRQASTTYAYDKLYRLTGVAAPSSTTAYSYDPNGNRLSKVLSGQTTSSTYDKADRILTAGTTNYTVNNAGNETARGSDAFGYDQVNRLTSASVSGATGAYHYDGDGKRTSKTVGSTTTSYAYDIAGGLPNVLDDGARKYVWGAGGLAYTVDKSTAAIAAYHTDGLGSVRAITDGTGSVVQTYQTDEFGIPTLSQGTSGQPFGYTGEQRDPESGLLYLRARSYDPTTGRFQQRDPTAGDAAASQSLNRFIYVGNNPARMTDPSGEALGDWIHQQIQAEFVSQHPFFIPEVIHRRGNAPSGSLLGSIRVDLEGPGGVFYEIKPAWQRSSGIDQVNQRVRFAQQNGFSLTPGAVLSNWYVIPINIPALGGYLFDIIAYHAAPGLILYTFGCEMSCDPQAAPVSFPLPFPGRLPRWWPSPEFGAMIEGGSKSNVLSAP